MCCNFTKLRQNFSAAKEEISMLSFRKFKSDYHARRWVDYEKVLMARTWFSTLSRIILSAVAVASGTENWHLTQDYINKGTIPNMELAIEMFPYAKAAN